MGQRLGDVQSQGVSPPLWFPGLAPGCPSLPASCKATIRWEGSGARRGSSAAPNPWGCLPGMSGPLGSSAFLPLRLCSARLSAGDGRAAFPEAWLYRGGSTRAPGASALVKEEARVAAVPGGRSQDSCLLLPTKNFHPGEVGLQEPSLCCWEGLAEEAPSPSTGCQSLSLRL